jgi:hypothetical protein
MRLYRAMERSKCSENHVAAIVGGGVRIIVIFRLRQCFAPCQRHTLKFFKA